VAGLKRLGNEVLPSRIRFMSSDLIELRILDKHADSVPKTLAEIKNDLDKATAAKAGTYQGERRGSQRGSKRGGDRGGDRGRNGSLRNNMRDQSRYERPSGGGSGLASLQRILDG
jgi:hypothetical protein